MSLDIEERVTLDAFVPWDSRRCPAILKDDSRCKNKRYFVNYKTREYCAYHGKNRPRGKFFPNAEQLAAIDPCERSVHEDRV